MNDHGGVRAAFLTAGIEAAADAYLADCREILMTSDPTMMTEVTRPQLIQAMVSLALQRIMHWVALHRGEVEDDDAIPTQALIGAFTGVGISVAMLNYDPENVVQHCIPAMGRAFLDAQEMIDSEGSGDAASVN